MKERHEAGRATVQFRVAWRAGLKCGWAERRGIAYLAWRRGWRRSRRETRIHSSICSCAWIFTTYWKLQGSYHGSDHWTIWEILQKLVRLDIEDLARLWSREQFDHILLPLSNWRFHFAVGRASAPGAPTESNDSTSPVPPRQFIFLPLVLLVSQFSRIMIQIVVQSLD